MPRPTVSVSSTAQPSMTFAIVPFSTDVPLAVSTLPTTTLPANIASEQITHRYTSTAPPPTLDIEVPTCFKRVNGGYSCFGKLWNRSQQTIGSVSLKVEILDSSTQALAEQIFTIEQSIIPNNSFASYRVLFEPFSGNKANIRTTVMQQFPTSLPQSPLKIANERGLLMESGRYRLTATIENNLDKSFDTVRIFATLMNPEREIVGYRIYEVNGVMQPTERRAVDFEIIPQVSASYFTHVLYAEGHIEEIKVSSEENNIQP